MPFDENAERANREKFEEMLKLRSAMKPDAGNPETPGETLNLSDNDFEQAVKGHPIMVVDFWAPWCQPCRIVSPILEELATEYAGRVTFGKLNVDESPVVAATLGIQSIPTILIFKDGKPVDGMVGAVPKSQVESKIKANMGGGSRHPSPYQ